MPSHHTIPITAVDAAGHAQFRCHDCPHVDHEDASEARPVGEPRPVLLDGPADRMDRLVAALWPEFGLPDGRLDGRRVRSLRLAPGEVELALATDLRGQNARCAEAAFQILRGLLPDTDIYVTSVPAAEPDPAPGAPGPSTS